MVCVDVTRGTAYGLCFSQILITLGVVTYSPLVEVQLFTANVLLNRTLHCEGLNSTVVAMPLPFLLCSALVVSFCTITMSLSERGLADYEYTEQGMEELGMWDLNFAAYVYLSHLLVAAVVSTPGDAYQIFMSGLFMGFFLLRSCAPRGERPRFVVENANLLGYFLGAWLAFHACAEPSRVYALCSFIFMDYFLGVGHLWENPVFINTVINCRLSYVCATSLALSFTYFALNP